MEQQQQVPHVTQTALERPGAGAAVPEPKPAPPLTRRLSFPRWVGQVLANRKAALGVAILVFFALVAIVGPLIWPGDPMPPDYSAPPMSGPSPAHWLGTDQIGPDVFRPMADGPAPVLCVGCTIG